MANGVCRIGKKTFIPVSEQRVIPLLLLLLLPPLPLPTTNYHPRHFLRVPGLFVFRDDLWVPVPGKKFPRRLDGLDTPDESAFVTYAIVELSLSLKLHSIPVELSYVRLYV